MPEETKPELVTSVSAELLIDIGGVEVLFVADDMGGAEPLYAAKLDFSKHPKAFSNFLKKLLPEGTPSFLTDIDVQDMSLEIGSTKGKGMNAFSATGTFLINEQPFNILFLYQKADDNKAHTLFLTRYQGTINFADFPLVGPMFPEGSGLQGLTLAYANTAMEANLEAVFDPSAANPTPSQLAQGLSIVANLSLGSLGKYPLGYGMSDKEAKSMDETDKPQEPTPPPAQKEANTKEIAKKTSSGLTIQQVKMLFKDKRIGVLLGASLDFSGFELSVTGLEVTVPMEVLRGEFAKLKEVEFKLQGLSLGIDRKGFTLAGAFLRSTHKYPEPYNGQTEYDDYSGLIQMGFGKFQLAGLGSYADYQGMKSLFLFAYLGFPIGGAPPFFVTGLAVGFGINRNFIAPTIDKVLDFPLIKIATPTEAKAVQAKSNGLAELMLSLHTYIPPSAGDYFLVAGINFTSFKIISTQALLAVKFGNDLEVTLLGVSRLSMPAVYVELMFMAQFIPAQGIFMVRGQLTSNSYLFSTSVRLTGGFAVGFWFSGQHAGDFVVSIGGYHPRFQPPAHFPTNIPRVGINWRVSEYMTIRGEMYFALTPQAIMAGLLIEAVYDSGSVYACLRISLDVIIYWKPFYYEASLEIHVAVRFTIGWKRFSKDINISITAGVLIWGPDFSGIAYLDCGIKTFKIAFGADAPRRANPISWPDFKTAFIPAEPCSIAITGGLLSKVQYTLDGKSVEVHMVNPKELMLVTDSMVPATELFFQGKNQSGNSMNTQLGVAPMNSKSFTAKHQVSVKKYNNAGQLEDVSTMFRANPLMKNMPKALWGQGLPSNDPAQQGEGLVNNVLAGVELKLIQRQNTVPRLELNLAEANKTSFKWPFLNKYYGNDETAGRDSVPTSRKTKSPEMQALFKNLGLTAEDDQLDAFEESETVFQLRAKPLLVH